MVRNTELITDDKKIFLDEINSMTSSRNISHCESVLMHIKFLLDSILRYSEKTENWIELAEKNERIFNLIKIKAFGIDKIINLPKRINHDNISDLPIVSVFNHDQIPIFLNKGYLNAIWINDFQKVLGLAKKWILYKEIYTEESLEKILLGTSKIKETWWYVDATFQTKLTDRNLKFNTINHPWINWSVRVAEDVTDLWFFANYILKNTLEDIPELKFNFQNDWSEYKALIKKIFLSSPKTKQILDHFLNWEENFDKIFKYIDFMTLIWDKIVDKWPFLIYYFDWKNHFYNKRYVQTSNYEINEFQELFNSWNVVNSLYWYWNELNNVLFKVASLSPGWSYNAVFTIRRKDETYIDVNWWTYWHDNDWTSFRIWKIVSPVHLLDFLLSIRDLKTVF